MQVRTFSPFQTQITGICFSNLGAPRLCIGHIRMQMWCLTPKSGFIRSSPCSRPLHSHCPIWEIVPVRAPVFTWLFFFFFFKWQHPWHMEGPRSGVECCSCGNSQLLYNPLQHSRNSTWLTRILLFFFFPFSFTAASMTVGGSQASGLIGAVAANLRQSHSNTKSELHL